MINITDKQNCCGCGACVQKCPKQCISFHEDNEGFLYPQVDATICIDCGLCEKVCPMLNPAEARKPLQVLAAINKDEKIRMESSSGGIFTLLAEKIINEGGVVFGARFDEEWQVTIDYTETIEGLAAFRGSKYVQARTGESFKQCEQFLKEGRKVLYTGTPCQISGLKHYLTRDYDNLFTVDIVCHGVPSPIVWDAYLKNKCIEIAKDNSLECLTLSNVTRVDFRNKRNGWLKYGIFIETDVFNDSGKRTACFEQKDKNLYLTAYLRNAFLRPSCYNCKAKDGRSLSDITVADFWGVKEEYPKFYDVLGVSCVLLHNSHGSNLYKQVNAKSLNVELNTFIKHNPTYSKNTQYPERRKKFWRIYFNSGAKDALKKTSIAPLKERVRYSIIRIIVNLGLYDLIKRATK